MKLDDMRRLVLVRSARWHYPAQNKLAVLLFHEQQYKKYATVLHIIFNNALSLMVDFMNICEFK
jgi:hypothetical protein